MGKQSTTLSVLVDVNAKVDKAKAAIEVFKNSLSNIKLSDSLSGNVNKILTKLETEFANFQGLSEKEIFSEKDSKQVKKSFETIIDLMNTLQAHANTIEGLDVSKLIPKDFIDQIKSFGKELKALTDEQKALDSSLEQKTKEKTAAEDKYNKALKARSDLQKKIDSNKNTQTAAAEEQAEAQKRINDLLEQKKTIESKKTKADEEIKQKKKEVEEVDNLIEKYQEYQKLKKKDNKTSQEKSKVTRFENQNQDIINKGRSGALTKRKNNLEAEVVKLEGIELSSEEMAKLQEIEEAIQKEEQIINQQKAIATKAKNNIAKSTIDLNVLKDTDGLDTLKTEIEALEKEVNEFNSTLDPTKLEGFRQKIADFAGVELDEIPTDLAEIEKYLIKIQSTKVEEVSKDLEGVGETAKEVKAPMEELRKSVDDLGETGKHFDDVNNDIQRLKQNIIDFFSIGNAVQLFKRAVKSAFDTVKELDATMTEAAVVTDFSVGDMWDKLPEYSAGASELGAKINDLYGATTLYYQQGLKTNEAMALGTETMKMARIAGMESAEATEAMTAALRGFNMELNETSATRVNDVYSELAAITAADTEQIATAMSKTASIASAANMEFESTAAFLSQIIETTQEAPETAGTALKTIIARFSEVKSLREKGLSSGEDGEGEIIDVNKIQGALRTVGISMDEFFAGTEGLDSVLMKLASKWETLDFETQRYIATTAAGSRQQSRFIAMMSNYDRTMELVSAANNSAGASQEQFGKTLESLDAKLNNLKNAWDQFVMGLANNDLIKAGVDVLTFLLETINKIISSLSGGSGIVKTFVTAIGAIGAFKLGQKGLNKLFPQAASKGGIASLILGDGKKFGQGWALKLGNGIKDGIKKIKTGEMSKNLLEKIGITQVTKEIKGKDLTKEIGLDKLTNFDFGKNFGNPLKSSLLKQFKSLPQELKGEMTNLDFGKILMNSKDLDSLKKAIPPELHAQLGLIGQDAANAGAQMTKMQSSMQTVGTVAGAAGGALMMFAGILEEAGASDELVTVVKGLGIAFMALSAIMPILQTGFVATGAAGVSSGIATQLAWWWLMLIVAAVALLVAGLVAAGQAAKKASLAGQLEAAQKAAEGAAEAANKAKEAYDDLLSGKSEYDELQNTLENLTKGTDEWKKALIEANSQVLELLTTYPELAKYVSRGEDGQLIISEVGWDEVLNQQLADTQRAQGAAMAAKMQETRISGQIAEKDFLTKFKNDTMTMAYDAALMATAGVAHNAMALTPGAGGAAAYLAEDYIAQGFENQGYGVYDGAGSDSNFVYDAGLIEELRNLNIDADSGGLTEANEAVKELMDTYGKTEEEIRELITALNEYDAAVVANQELLQAQAEQALTAGADEEILASDYNDAVVEAYANQMTTDDYQASIDASAKAYGVKNDDKRQELMEQRGLEFSGDRTKDLEVLYADLHGLQSIEDIPDDIKGNNDALAEAIATAMANEEQTGKMEKFQERLNNIGDDKTKREVASLLSGNASMLSMKQITELSEDGKNLGDYYEQLGYDSKEELIADQGYLDKTYSELNREDQEALAAKEGGPTREQYTDEEGNFDAQGYEEALNQWINSQTGVVTAEVQFELDQEQMIQEMTEKTNKASEAIKGKTGIDLSQSDLSGQTIQNLAEQTSTMGKAAATEYVKNFQNVIDSSDLTGTELDQLENYLSSVDWSNMTQATQAMEYMQNLGIDASTIEAYWNAATDGANTFVSSIAEALGLVERLQGNIRGVSEISERLSEGKGTYEDVQKMISVGADVSDFQLTADGWKATGDALTKATDQMKEYNAEQAKAVADQHQEALTKAQNNNLDGFKVNEDGTISYAEGGSQAMKDITTINDKGKLVGGTVTTDNAEAIGTAIGATAYDSENETYDQYVERIQTAYNEYINLLNNGEDIAIINEKAAAYAEASTMSADENQAKGGTQESVIYSAQNEAKEAGLDVSELMAYADTLTNIDSGATRVQVALANMKMNAGLGEVIDSYDEWSKVIDKDTGALKDTSSTGVATYNKLKASVNKMLNTSKDLSDSFWENADNMKNIEKAAKGDEEALGELQKAAAADYIVQLAAETDDATVTNSLNKLSDLINDFEMPTLKPGDTLDDQTFIDKCNNLIRTSGMTATQVSEAFKQMGFDVEVETATGWYKRPVTTTYTTTSGDFPYNYTTTEHTETDYQWEHGEYPVVKTLTSTGTGGGGVSEQNKSGGGGGGGSSKKKSQHWENPYDKLYNVTEEIEELQRDRNVLEEEFNDLMEDGYLNAEKVSEAINKQAENLSRELALQRKVTAERKKQLASIQKEKYTYTKKNGKKEEEVTTTYKNAWSALGLDKTLGMSFEQLFKYDEERGVKILDVEALNKIVENQDLGEDQGALVESIIGKAEEWISSLEEAEDAARELEKQLKELEDIGKEDAIEMENRLAEALQELRQREIDDMQSLSETLSEANSSILDSLQESIDLERQIRDNTKQEEDIADMEARLAYLRRDTSGANQQEILQLEEQLGDARESYSDSLVDQQLQKLSDSNAKAEEQRQQQIELAQAQLDYQVESGEILREAENMLETMSPEKIKEILKEAENYDALSKIQQMDWMNDTNNLLEGWKIGMKNWELEEVKDKEGTIDAKDEDGNALKLRYDQEKGKWVDDATGNTYAAATWDEEKGTYVAYGKTEPEGTPADTPTNPTDQTPTETYPYGKPSEATKTVKKGQSGQQVKAVQYALNKLGYGNSGTQSVDGKFGSNTEKAVKAFQGAMSISKDGKVGPKTRAKFKAKQFKTGGLADFTGPAWLDGTKSKPEIILNQQDSKNFIMLKDVLAEILQGATSTKSGQKSGGDNYFDISIIVDEISSDYDVDQMAARIKQQIYDDSTYRNVNAINLIR